jgi:hypothetical protein
MCLPGFVSGQIHCLEDGPRHGERLVAEPRGDRHNRLGNGLAGASGPLTEQRVDEGPFEYRPDDISTLLDGKQQTRVGEQVR